MEENSSSKGWRRNREGGRKPIFQGESSQMKKGQVRWLTVKWPKWQMISEFNSEIISKSKPVEWLGPKPDWCGQQVNGWRVGKTVD